ncbi:MAG: DNA gyrase inhibitor YacG [Hyphomicrobiales bacterium]
MTTKATDPKPRAARPCPICSKMSVERYHPFCSERCGNIDLHRWLGGSYRLPTEEPADFAESGPGPDDTGED